jgi:hypothetical protein
MCVEIVDGIGANKLTQSRRRSDSSAICEAGRGFIQRRPLAFKTEKFLIAEALGVLSTRFIHPLKIVALFERDVR